MLKYKIFFILLKLKVKLFLNIKTRKMINAIDAINIPLLDPENSIEE